MDLHMNSKDAAIHSVLVMGYHSDKSTILLMPICVSTIDTYMRIVMPNTHAVFI